METRGRPDPTTLAFHASRIVTDLGVLLILASMNLTYVTAPGGDRTAMALDALPALLLVAPIFIVTLLPDHTRPLPRPVAWGALVLGLVAFPYAIVKYLDAVVLADTLDGTLGLGVRLLVFGAFVTIVGIVIGLTRSWMGLPSGGSPTRRTAVPTARRGPAPDAPAVSRAEASRPRPARAVPEQNPFTDPLFDSLEIPETRAPEAASTRHPDLVYDAGGAADRSADEGPEPPRDRPPGR
ncbi:MAG TPA: hypothetical protein VJA44_05380 [Acidimicrobiia bacterium]|nr:hypothetical protein [Acidimicrobiia bacterium]